jgi:hypothetical protein
MTMGIMVPAMMLGVTYKNLVFHGNVERACLSGFKKPLGIRPRHIQQTPTEGKIKL